MLQVQKDINIAPLLWYRLGGKVKYLLSCKNKEDVLSALEFISKENIKNVLIIGQGSNLIFAKNYFDGAIIHITGDKESFQIKSDNTVSSFSGEVLDDLILFTFHNNLIGLEWAGGLPGTVGAGVRGNVGAFGGEIKDTFLNAEVAEIKEGKIQISNYTKNDMNFSYRESKVKQQKNSIILNSSFLLNPASEENLKNAKETYEKNKNYRKSRHPIEYPNCGSVFKNINRKEDVEKIFQIWPDVQQKALSDWYGKVSMGYIINRLGFTGKEIGGARVSTKHSNFIINTGKATGQDVLSLIHQIQKSFKNTFGFTPEIEPEIIDE